MMVERVRIGEILELRRDPVTIDPEGQYRRIGIYSWGKGFLHRPPVSGAEMGSLRYFTMPEGALVLSNIQAWEAAAAVSGPAERMHVASNRFLPYMPIDNTRVSVDYLLHYFLSEDGLAALRRASPGTQVRNRTLGQRLFEATSVPLPGLGEQLRLVRRLDQVAELALSLSCTERAHRVARQAIIDRSIERGEHHLRPLTEVAVISRQVVPVQPGQEYQTLGLLNRGRGVFSRGLTKGSETKYNQYYRVKSKQLIYSKLFGWEGSVAVVPERYDGFYVSPEFPTFDIDPSLARPKYVEHIISWSGFAAQLGSATTGMGQRRQRVNIADFLAIKVPLPQLAEQDRVVDCLERATRVSELLQRRAKVAAALLPAARNEVFSALR